MVSGGKVAILLATHNGAAWLERQLTSLAALDWAKIDVFASDDGSTDATPKLLATWQKTWSKGQFRRMAGPRQGFAANFRSLLAHPGIDADYVAFCDQDDIWLPGKMLAAAAALQPEGEWPALYCERTVTLSEDGRDIGRSPLFEKPPSFANALVQSIAGGNTMVLNRAAHRLMREAARRTDFVSHDWFCYLVVTGAGGKVIYSPTPHVLYRQHATNLVGSNTGLSARLDRIRAAWGGRFTRWNAHNLKTLAACRDLLTPEAIRQVDAFAAARAMGDGPLPRLPLLKRLGKLGEAGVYRQTVGGQLSLYAAAALGKL